MAADQPVDDATIAILGAVSRAAIKHERPGIAATIERCRSRLGELASTVVVLGEHNKGKSTLINALLMTEVCGVDPVHPTSVTTVVSHGLAAEASLTFVSLHDDAVHQSATISEAIRRQTAPPNSHDQLVARISLSVPSPLLRARVRLVDTAPTGRTDAAESRAARMLVDGASAVLVVVDASRELTESDLELIASVHTDLTPVTCVMTKIDFYPRWRDVAQRSRDHLAAKCPGVELLTVSSSLRIEGSIRDDQSLLDESGFVRLIDALPNVSQVDSLDVRTRHAHDVAADALASMAVTLEIERDALADPSQREALAHRAQEAHERVEALRSASSRWGTVLSDGISDLNSSVDLQIRTRLRAAIAAVEETIEESDPGDTGDELIPQIEAMFMAEVAEVHAMIETEANALAQRVAEVFDEEAEIDALALPGGQHVFEEVTQREVEITPAASRGASLFTGLRGSYSGIAIFGMAGGLLAPALGAVLLGPLSLVAGAVFGRKLAVDERKRQLTARRAEARAAVRRYGDEATLHISKHCRDSLQIVQRSLRDENLARAAVLAETASGARDAADKAVRIDRNDAERRLDELETEIEEIRAIERELIKAAGDSALAEVSR